MAESRAEVAAARAALDTQRAKLAAVKTTLLAGQG